MSFTSQPGFCCICGTVLPMLGDVGGVKCFNCNTVYGPDAFGAMESHYVLPFNSINTYTTSGKDGKGGSESRNAAESAEGPVVERKCPKCPSEKMSYATLQLRSADEGQTVFYTCIKCKYKETENS